MNDDPSRVCRIDHRWLFTRVSLHKEKTSNDERNGTERYAHRSSFAVHRSGQWLSVSTYSSYSSALMSSSNSLGSDNFTLIIQPSP